MQWMGLITLDIWVVVLIFCLFLRSSLARKHVHVLLRISLIPDSQSIYTLHLHDRNVNFLCLANRAKLTEMRFLS